MSFMKQKICRWLVQKKTNLLPLCIINGVDLGSMIKITLINTLSKTLSYEMKGHIELPVSVCVCEWMLVHACACPILVRSITSTFMNGFQKLLPTLVLLNKY